MGTGGTMWRANSGMQDLLRRDRAALRANGYQRTDSTLEVVLRPGVTAQRLEASIRTSDGRRDPSYWLVRSAGWVAGLAIGGVVLLLLAVVDMFNELLGNVVTDRTLETAWQLGLLAITFILGAAAVSFAPQIMAGDGGWIRSRLSTWFDGEAKALSRINRRLALARSRDLVDTVIVWNALEPDSLGIEGLLTCFANLDLDVELRVHHDERDALMELWTRGRLEQQQPIGIIEQAPPLDPDAELEPDLIHALGQIAGVDASRALAVALLASSLRATEVWRDALDRSSAFPNGIVSAGLAASWFEEDGAHSVPGSHAVPARTWLMRLAVDYGLLRVTPLDETLEFPRPAAMHAAMASGHDSLLSYERRHRGTAPLARDLESDVTATFVAMLATSAADWGHLTIQKRLNRYVTLARDNEHYLGLAVFAALVEQEVDLASSERRLLPRLSIDTIRLLPDLFSIASRTDLAVWVARWVKPLSGDRGVIDRAYLLERAGDIEGAANELSHLDASVLPLAARLDAVGAETLSAGQADLLHRYSAANAWVILSAGSDEADLDAAAARRHLERIDRLSRQVRTVEDPVEARRVENYWALLLEWEGDLRASVERHRRASEMPGVPLRFVLGSTINMGRAMRDLAVTPLLEAHHADLDTWRRSLHGLEAGIEVIRRGFDGKREIGDTDEAPIGAHNLALAELLRAAVAERCGLDPVPYAEAAFEAAVEGIRILEQSRSTRKLSALVAEGRRAAQILATTMSAAPTLPAGLLDDPGPLSAADQASIDTVDRVLTAAGLVSGDNISSPA